ncbi:hypothetical protein [Komagataeibacter xylinus]|uniref:hypothetical protein n=1 Tax=Komagataeibacter xylinus TaxID=28448 RepID=UPI0013EE536B|nr:hypothetical protein [Komagataeibacter xylinus]
MNARWDDSAPWAGYATRAGHACLRKSWRLGLSRLGALFYSVCHGGWPVRQP